MFARLTRPRIESAIVAGLALLVYGTVAVVTILAALEDQV